MRLEKTGKEVKQQNMGVRQLPSDVSQHLSFNDSLWMKERETKERSRELRACGGGGWRRMERVKQHKKRQKWPSRHTCSVHQGKACHDLNQV